ncbi:MAG: DNA polymerase III subunit delta [bacterium]|nr:DNA polymerase III subunit delta [bacterium]
MHIFEYLKTNDAPLPVVVCFGDDPFLKQLAVQHVQSLIASDDDDAPRSTFDSDSDWSSVVDELSTMMLFGGGVRFVVVEEADAFVSRNRHQLESYVETPTKNGVLVLSVGTWAANTRLYKAVEKVGTNIDCKAPTKSGRSKKVDEDRVCQWIIDRAKTPHRTKTNKMAAHKLLDLIGVEFGLLDQALSKMALFAGVDGNISPEMVDEVIGGWKSQTVWELADAVCEGRADDALKQLHRLIHAGESPFAIFSQLASTLRRFAKATRLFQSATKQGKRPALSAILLQAGFPKFPTFVVEKAQRQIKQIGSGRTVLIYRWLLETDLALKGTHSRDTAARRKLEQLIFRLSKAAAPVPASS